jgi:hypothetical protein
MTDLNKFIARETSVEVDGKPLVVTLTPTNTIRISQKGKGGKTIEISIEELFKQMLEGGGTKPLTKDDSGKMIRLTDFRTKYLVSPDFDLNTKVKLEQITTTLLRGE